MRIFQFDEPHHLGKATITVTEEDIKKNYFPYWCEQMKKAGKENLINFESCIEDFITVNWATEIK